MNCPPVRTPHSDCKATAKARRRPLRLEHLEPRMLLSAGLASQSTSGKRATSSSALAIGPVADAYVSSNSAWTNYGTKTDLLLQRGGGFNSAATAAYLKFDLSSMSGAVSSAVLNLTPLSVNVASPVTIRVQLLADSADGWVEGIGGTNRSATGAITWANSAHGTGLVVTLSAAQLKKGSSIAIDVTKLLQQSINLNGIASFVVEMTSQGRGTVAADFASRENATSGYRPTLTITTAGNAPTVAQQPTASNQTNTSVALSVLGADTEDAESALKYTWSVTSPAGATKPTFSSNGSNSAKSTTVTLSDAGTYVFTATITDSSGLSVTTSSVTVTVGQVLTGLSVSPSKVTMVLGATQKFTASGVDQFGDVMTLTSSGVTWTATRGSFSGGNAGTSVTYVAPSAAGTATVTATYGSLSVAASMTIIESSFLGLLDPTLAALTQSLDADGSISRADMIAILRSVENESDGVVDSQDMSDLKTILSNSSTLGIANYVLVLAGDVVYGSTANAHYLGQKLGNLAIGSTAAQLEKLIDKWFLGTDLPTTGGYSYDTSTAGTLYGTSAISHANELQGNLGDCYLLSALGSIADSSSSAIKNMFIANGDGTWTVRFYWNGTADYVTVNSQLPVDASGKLIFDGYGTSSTSTTNVLWLELLEKAYAQWNETGKAGRDQAENSYSSIEGGWMGDVYQQALGYASTYCQDTSASSAKQALIDALAAGQAVTIGTRSFNYDATTKLYGNHAYNVISYSSSTGKFTLYNPWGSDQPSQLTWNQIRQYCDAFAATATNGLTSMKSSSRLTSSSWVIAPPVAATPLPMADETTSEGDAVAASASADYDRARSAAADAVFADPADNLDTFDRMRTCSWSRSDVSSFATTLHNGLTRTSTDWLATVDSAFNG
jgi:hypothetical protein